MLAEKQEKVKKAVAFESYNPPSPQQHHNLNLSINYEVKD